jgi:hypothetical protein
MESMCKQEESEQAGESGNNTTSARETTKHQPTEGRTRELEQYKNTARKRRGKLHTHTHSLTHSLTHAGDQRAEV